MSLLYRRYFRLLEKWPIDNSKKDRDLGYYIREQVKVKFTLGNLNKNVDEESCTKTLESLQRILNDHHRNKYTKRAFSATGLTAEQCRGVLSDEFLQYLMEQEKGFIRRLF